jgi:hypothetical protein
MVRRNPDSPQSRLFLQNVRNVEHLAVSESECATSAGSVGLCDDKSFPATSCLRGCRETRIKAPNTEEIGNCVLHWRQVSGGTHLRVGTRVAPRVPPGSHSSIKLRAQQSWLTLPKMKPPQCSSPCVYQPNLSENAFCTPEPSLKPRPARALWRLLNRVALSSDFLHRLNTVCTAEIPGSMAFGDHDDAIMQGLSKVAKRICVLNRA